LVNPLNNGKSVDLIVYFETNEAQAAISWLPKESTTDK